MSLVTRRMTLGALLLLAFLFGTLFSTIVILNSQDYQDVISAAVFAKSNGYQYVFAMTPNQSVFLVKYYTLNPNESVIYVEGRKAVLANMAALLKESGLKNLTVAQPASVPMWVARAMPRDGAIVVGSQYGQDALSVAPFASLTHSPIFFVDDPMDSQELLSNISAMGYRTVLFYGPVAHQIPARHLELIQSRRSIDQGSKYLNNLQITAEFLDIRPAAQAMLVSGHAFEKSMADPNFPLLLVGRSDVPAEVPEFMAARRLNAGVVFSGDSDIGDGVARLRAADPNLSVFVKFGEGYLYRNENTQPLPLMIIPLPAPKISMDVLNLTYNVPAKAFELRMRNTGDFAAIAASVSVPGVGAAESSQIAMDPNTETTLGIGLDSLRASDGRVIPQAQLTVRYGEDARLLENVDTVSFVNVPISYYNDSSFVRVLNVTYLSDEKAFAILLDGHGWMDGQVRFLINGQPISLRIGSVLVNGPTQVKVKYLLSQDEERFVNGIYADYFIRSGDRSDILVKETRGQNTVAVPSLAPGKSGGMGGLPTGTMLLAAGVVLAVAAVLFYFTRRQRDYFE